MKIKSRYIFGFIVIALLITIIWKIVPHPPSKFPFWTYYSNEETGNHYSFWHPPEWVVTECGNGEVVLGKEKVEKCLRPLEADQKYIDTVYYQTFTAENNAMGSKESFDSNVIPGWEAGYWRSNDLSGYSCCMVYDDSYPIDLKDSKSYYRPTGYADTVPVRLAGFTLVKYHVDDPEISKIYDEILNSMSYEYVVQKAE